MFCSWYTLANESEAIELNQMDFVKSPGGKGGDKEESKVGKKEESKVEKKQTNTNR